MAEVSPKGGNLHLPATSRLADTGQSRNLPISRKVAFLDRDGVLNEDVGYLSTWKQLKPLNGVASAIRQLQERFYVVVVTNQSGIARGYFGEDDLLQIHRHLAGQLEQDGAFLDAIYFCPHYAEGTVQRYAIECDCRKPQPGMLLRAQRDWNLELAGSYIVGDQPTDVEAGKNAGATGILVGRTSTCSDEEFLSALNLIDAANQILNRNTVSIKPEHGENNE